MKDNQHRFFIALLPPEQVQQSIRETQQYFDRVYNSRAALKSPPHITLQPPFEWQLEQLSILEQKLTEFSQNQTPIPIILDNFAAFKPRVIFVNVIKTPELLSIQQNLSKYLESSLNIVQENSKNRPFAPHLTVAYRDLTKPNFKQAWQEFQTKELHFKFTLSQLTLLKHNGKFWETYKQFNLQTL